MRTTREATRELLVRLLDGYERSRSYGRPGPWPRDVIVKLDARTFPDAFAPDGREALQALRTAAERLAAAGAARLVRAADWHDEEVRELRLGPDELAAAYALAREHGYEPLDDVLRRLATHAEALVPGAPGWFAAFMADVARGCASNDLSALGVSLERCKREHRDLLQAMTAAAHIARGVTGWERMVSERIFGASKRLAELRAKVADLLVRADPRARGWTAADPQDVLELHGVRRKPGLIQCAGCAELRVGPRRYALEDFVPVAHLPESWAAAWVDGLAAAGTRVLTTIENEYPFMSYVEERGGPLALGAAGEVVVYTAGFPTPALAQALTDLCLALPELRLRHFGDADLGGLRIWWHLRRRVDRAVALFRVDRAWLDRQVADRGGTPLTASERHGIVRLRRELDRGTFSLADDVRQVLELIDGLLTHGIKVEQERED